MKSTISQHNHQYNVNTAQQHNAGCIPKAFWDQLPPYAKPTISNSQHHTKQQANSTTAHSNNHTDHFVADTLPTYASNSVHHMPTDMGPPFNNKILNSIMSSLCSSTSNTWSINVNSSDCLIHSNGSYYTLNMAHITYWCSQAISDSIRSLIDGGANGRLPGTDVCMLKHTKQCADTTGVAQASINEHPLLTCAGMVHMTQGPIILIMHQYAYYGKGSTVHSIGQLSRFFLISGINPQGSQATSNEHLIGGSFLSILLALTRMPIHHSMDEDLDELPHVIIMSDDILDSTVLDHLIDIENDIYHATIDPNIDKEDFTSFRSTHL